MTATRRPASIPTDAEVLRQLGLDGRATPEEVARRHDELVAFLASAPRSLWPWARSQAALADDAYATLSDPSALRRSEALSDRVPRTAPQPGGPATPPARQANLAGADRTNDEGIAAAPAEDESFEDLLAAVTPTTHRDSAPARGSRTLGAFEDGRPGTKTSSLMRDESRAPGASRGLRRLAIGVVALVIVVGAGYGIYQYGNPAAAANAQPTAGPTAQATPALDQAKVADLMAKVQKDPKDVASLLALGDEFFKAGDYTTSADWLEKVVAIDGKNVTARLALGAARFNLGESDAAKAQWLEVLKLDTKNVEAHYDLGFLYFNAEPQDLAGVQREWGQVIELAPGTDVANVVKAHLDALASQAPTTSGTPSAAPSSASSPAPSAPSATIVPSPSVAP